MGSCWVEIFLNDRLRFLRSTKKKAPLTHIKDNKVLVRTISVLITKYTKKRCDLNIFSMLLEFYAEINSFFSSDQLYVLEYTKSKK